MDHNDSRLGTVIFTQSVLTRKLWEEYRPIDGPASRLPAVAGKVLRKGENSE